MRDSQCDYSGVDYKMGDRRLAQGAAYDFRFESLAAMAEAHAREAE